MKTHPVLPLETLLREYKELGGRRRLRALVTAYEGILRGLANRSARWSLSNLHDKDDLYAVLLAELHFAVQAFEFRCGRAGCRAACLTLTGLRAHARAAHRVLGAEPAWSLYHFVYWRLGRAVQRVLNRERAGTRAADSMLNRADNPGTDAYFTVLGPDPRAEMDYTLDTLRLLADVGDTLPNREREILVALLEDAEGGELGRELAVRYRLTPDSAKMAVSRTRRRVREGVLLPGLV